MEQNVRASLIGEEDGRLLKTESGAIALRVIRRYLAGDGTVIQVADNIHPADRFSLSMTYERE